eukprot:484483_1
MNAIVTATASAKELIDDISPLSLKSPKSPLLEPKKWRSDFIFSRLILGFWIATGHYNSVKYILHEKKYKWTKRLAKLWSYIIRFAFLPLICYTWWETMNNPRLKEQDNESNGKRGASSLQALQLTVWTLIIVLSFLCLYKNIGYYNTNFMKHVNQITINHHHIPRKELFIYIFLTIGSVAFINVIPYFKMFCSADDKLEHFLSGIISVFLNIVSMYVFNITIVYLCLLHITNFNKFVHDIENDIYKNDMRLIKRAYNEMIKNFKYTKSNWEQWISILFSINMIYLSITVVLFVLSDYENVWTWCDQTFPQALLVLIWQAVRCVAILYPVVRLNSSFQRIPKYIFTHVEWRDIEHNGNQSYNDFVSADDAVMLLKTINNSDNSNKSGQEMDTKYLIKSLISYYDTKRFYEQLTKYPPSLNIIGFRAEWGSFKTLIFIGISATITAWIKYAFG